MNHLSVKQWLFAAGLLGAIALPGCSDDYYYADTEPSRDFLGASIYDYLQEDGGFNTFIRLIDDLDYKETLQRTGSKTVFPARDEAFERFFRSNPFGVTCYEELTMAQKKLLLNQAMINMAYLSDMLPNIGGSSGPTKNVAIRRGTQSSYYDTVQVCTDQELFNNENGYWSRFAEKGSITLVEEAPMIVHFTPSVMTARSISGEDFSLLHNGKTYNFGSNEIFVNGIRVIEQDKVCKNGYIHVLEEVLTPLRTMADAINASPNTKTFAKLLNRFCAPYYDAGATADIKRNFTGADPKFPLIEVDSVFRKGYFNRQTHATGPKGERLGDDVLRFDPASVSYSGNGNVYTDMGVMFVPTDQAMKDYYSSPEGKFLKSNYPTWDDVPVPLLAKFIQNHQKNSFLTSLPHDWANLNDEKSFPMNITVSDIDHVELCSNGVVYYLNKVVPPVDFRATYAPTLVTDNVKIMKWALLDGEDLSDANGMRFFMYLYSMENMYNLIVPIDEAFSCYRDPVTWNNTANPSAREIWEFYYDEERGYVCARVYGITGEGVKDPENLKRTVTDRDIIRSRFRDILDRHTVVGRFVNGVMSGYLNEGNPGNIVITKGGAPISVSGLGNNLTLNGMGDVELSMPRASIAMQPDGSRYLFDNDNGRTYFIDHILHSSNYSVYDILGSNPEFKAFRDLCMIPSEITNQITADEWENDREIQRIFEQKTGSISSVGTVVSFFNNYRYTVFVPTAEAIDRAIAADPDLYTWDQIKTVSDHDEMIKRTKALLKFVRYHFVDDAMYINGLSSGSSYYNSSARTAYNTFHRVTISRTPETLTVTDENGLSQTIRATADTNISACEILYHKRGIESYIDATSNAVIHLVDRALTLKK